MNIRSRKLAIGFALGLFALTVTGAEAQSLFATRGIGFPARPQDARSAALGGTRLGLPGSNLSWANPAAAVGLPAPGLIFSYQYDDFDADLSGQADGQLARFPMILAGFPVGDRYALEIGFGNFLEQNWRIIEADTLDVAGEEVPVADWWQSQGGANRFRFGGAATVVEGLSVGLGLYVYTGAVDRLLGRAFPNEASPACCASRWEYRGAGLTAGVHWAPSADAAVGLAVGYGGTLTAEPRDETSVQTELDLPLTFEAGGSGRLGPNTLVAVNGSWTGWSKLDAELAETGGATNGWTAGAGVEWDGIVIGARPIPLRLGARTERLPFRWSFDDEAGTPTERALSIGTGLELAGGGVRPDVSFEFGSREADTAFDESFWRFAFSLRVLGL